MRDFQGRRWVGKRLQSLPVLLILIMVTILLGLSVRDLYEKNRYAKVNLVEARARVSELEQRKKQLTAALARLETAEGEELEIRSRFPVAKEGEKVLSIVDATSTTATSSVVVVTESHWWQFWK